MRRTETAGAASADTTGGGTIATQHSWRPVPASQEPGWRRRARPLRPLRRAQSVQRRRRRSRLPGAVPPRGHDRAHGGHHRTAGDDRRGDRGPGGTQRNDHGGGHRGEYRGKDGFGGRGGRDEFGIDRRGSGDNRRSFDSDERGGGPRDRRDHGRRTYDDRIDHGGTHGRRTFDDMGDDDIPIPGRSTDQFSPPRPRRGLPGGLKPPGSPSVGPGSKVSEKEKAAKEVTSSRDAFQAELERVAAEQEAERAERRRMEENPGTAGSGGGGDTPDAKPGPGEWAATGGLKVLGGASALVDRSAAGKEGASKEGASNAGESGAGWKGWGGDGGDDDDERDSDGDTDGDADGDIAGPSLTGAGIPGDPNARKKRGGRRVREAEERRAARAAAGNAAIPEGGAERRRRRLPRRRVGRRRVRRGDRGDSEVRVHRHARPQTAVRGDHPGPETGGAPRERLRPGWSLCPPTSAASSAVATPLRRRRRRRRGRTRRLWRTPRSSRATCISMRSS